ncbi:MAG: hypothetical protein SFV15_17620 [Polyangiaceae bacterium]|nr:hypothetical protein [Polyangiaceae bacterium]
MRNATNEQYEHVVTMGSKLGFGPAVEVGMPLPDGEVLDRPRLDVLWSHPSSPQRQAAPRSVGQGDAADLANIRVRGPTHRFLAVNAAPENNILRERAARLVRALFARQPLMPLNMERLEAFRAVLQPDLRAYSPRLFEQALFASCLLSNRVARGDATTSSSFIANYQFRKEAVA